MKSSSRGSDWAHDREILELYREICDSLSCNGGVHDVDDYLSSITGIERIPSKYNSGATCFVVRGTDSTRSVTFLLSAFRAFQVMRRPERTEGELRNNGYLNLTACNLLSACLAMRDLQRRKDKALPIDVYFMLVGDRDGTLCYQRFNPQYLRESIVGSIGHGTHLMVVESTGLRACIVQKGCIVFRLTISGRSHHPSFPWLGENPWEVLIKFEERLADTMKPKHDIYPVEVGKAPPMMLSNFLIGYPIMTPLRLEYHQPYAFGERSSIETEYYVSTPPEISHKEIEEKFSSSAKEIAKRIGCEATVTVAYREEPFRGDAKSAIVRATSSTFQKLTGFEPVFEWLPYPVSAKDLTSSGFAKDVMVLGPGDWAFSTSQDEKSIITEAMRASEILAQIPFEVALLEEKRQAK